MKLYCKNDKGVRLTLNREYEVIPYEKSVFSYHPDFAVVVINDAGRKACYSLARFKSLSDLREEKINSVLLTCYNQLD